MLKLNEKGWGYGFLIFFGALFLLLLISVGISIKSLTNKNKKNNPVPLNQTKNYDRMYALLESKLKNAGEYYILDNETYINEESMSTKISFNFLKSKGYIDDLLDPIYSTPCDGYVIVKSLDDITPYIQCSEYKTPNYSSGN